MHARTKVMWPLVVLGTVLLGGCELFMGPEARIERAEKAIAAGDMGAAVVDLKNVLQADASNSTARLLLAQAQLAQGELGAAAADFDKVDAAQVRPEQYQPVLWELRLAQRRYDEILSGMSGDVPGLAPPQRLTLLARAHLGKGDFAAARPLLEQAASGDPRNAEARALLGSVVAAAGDREAAIASLEGAAKDLPDSGVILRALAEIHARGNDLPQAEATYRRALELANPSRDLPAYVAAASGLGDVLLARNDTEKVDELLKSLDKVAPNAGVTVLLRGRAAAARRDFPTALENLQRLLNSDPDNAQLRTMVAAVNLEQGSAEQATMNLQRVLAANPDYAPARRLLAQAQIAQGRPADAARTLAAAGPDAAPEVVLMQARAALAAGDTAQAIGLLERLESSGLPTESVRLDLAAAFLQAGRAERALKLLGESPESAGDQRERLRLAALSTQDRPQAIAGLRDYATKNADKSESVTFAALALSALGETAAGTELLQKLAAAQPKDPEPLVNLARVQGRAGQLEGAEASLRRALELKPSADVQVALAQLAAARGDEPAAIRWLEQARSADPKATAPRALLARVYVAQRNFDAAQKIADELIALGGSSPDSRVLSAGIALQREDGERALRDVNEAVKLAPDSAGAWIAKGEVHERAKQFEEARAAFRRALTLAPTSPVPSGALARLELAAGNTEAALTAARRAQENPDTRTAGFRIEADVLAQAGRHADAARVLERAQQAQPTADGAVALYRARTLAKATAPERTLADWIQANPRDVAVRAVYAEHYQRAGDRKRAIAEYEGALKLEPNAAVLLNNLAWLYQEVGDTRALATARRAHELAPRNAAITDTLGWILVNQGELDQGIQFLREAADGAPGSVDIQYHLAQALTRKGDKAAAKAVVDRVLQASSGTPGATPEWRARFEELDRSLR